MPTSSNSWVAPVDIIAMRSRGSDLAVDHPDVGHHAAVDVVDGVEDHRAGRARRRRLAGAAPHARRGRAGRRRPRPVLPDTRSTSLGFAADDVGDLTRVAVRVGGGQVDLVQHGDDVQVAVQGQIEVGQGLRLDALRGVDQQHRALAGLQRARYLVGEVDVARGVDQMQHVIRAHPPATAAAHSAP